MIMYTGCVCLIIFELIEFTKNKLKEDEIFNRFLSFQHRVHFHQSGNHPDTHFLLIFKTWVGIDHIITIAPRYFYFTIDGSVIEHVF